MIDIESRLSDAAKSWIDKEARGLAGHPDAATWERYGAGDLTAEETETLRDHLVACRECRKLVLAGPKAGTTIVAEPEAGLGSADAEERRAWHKLRKRFDEVTPPVQNLPPAPPPEIWRWANRISPWLAVVSLSFAGWTWHQANQPRLGVVIAEAVPVGSSRGDAAPGGSEQGGEEGKGRPLALLVPLPPDLETGTPVRVEILDEDGAVEWRGESRSLAEGEFGLEVPPRYRRAGYQVRLSVPAGEGDTGETWKVLGTFGLPAPRGDAGEAATP